MDGPRACSSLTTPQAIKSRQITPSQLSRWLKVHGLHIYLLFISHSFQPQRTAGSTIQVVNTCVMVCFLLVMHSYFTSQMITLPCPGGLRAWKSLFVNGGCGQNSGCWLHSAQNSTVSLVILTAAASSSFSHSQTLNIKSHSFRSSSRAMGTSATSTQSTIAS